jgi:maleamate amidohydrolase
MQLERRSPGAGQRPALVLVDLSYGFSSGDSALGGDFDAVLAAAADLLAAFRLRALPVCFTTVVYSAPDQARVFRQRLPALELLQAGSRWVEIDARVRPRDGEPVFAKHWASGFFATPLAGWLRQQGADAVVVCGLTTSGCVRATAVDALQHDYPVAVVREACGDRDPAAHLANLHDLHAKYADVMDLAVLLAALPAAQSEVAP